tara:strand:+ start:13568 stop:14281 length:714 start_codon:yes stop_codon:yes gene_type:complete
MLEFIKNKKVMVVAAHPDDELLGLGATMHKLIKEYKVKTHVVILGEGITSRSDKRDFLLWEKELAIHKSNIKKAHKAIGYNSSSIYDFPDNRFDSIPLLDLIKIIEKEKSEFKPDIIFTHHQGDLNIDHQKTFEAVITASRPLENENVKMILTFETPSSTEWQSISDPRHFKPNIFFKVSEKDIDSKIRGMESYDFERRDYPHPRSAESLRIIAKKWGINIGVDLAEAFHLVRLINK